MTPPTNIPDPSSADEIEHDERERRTAKHVLFLLIVVPLVLLITVLLVFFQPDSQVVVTRHENGYPATRSHFVLGSNGRPTLQGLHESWYMDGTLAEHGRYEDGLYEGEWRFWNPAGELQLDRSGLYSKGERVSGLPAER